jgi:hypothetical protein
MKKLIFILILLPMVTIGQKRFNRYIDSQIKQGIDSIQLQVSITNYCLNQFYKEKMISYFVQIAGLAAVFYGTNDRMNGTNDAFRIYQDLLNSKPSTGYGDYIIKLRKSKSEYYSLVDRNDLIVNIGSAVAVSGVVLNIVAHRWLKKSYILPAEHGIGVMIKF